MNAVNALLERVQNFAGQHDLLRNYFDAFHARCRDLATAPASSYRNQSLVPASVGDLDPQGHFTLSYAGASGCVQFITAATSDGKCVGIVRTLTTCTVTGIVGEPVEHFRFGPSGVTNLDFPDVDIKAAIQDGYGSCLLFATIVLSLLPETTTG